MKRLLFSLAFIIVFGSLLHATPDEGMWLPLYIKKYNEKKMQEMGCKLTADDIYNINHASVKDAVLRLGTGFCTGELVSSQGLVFTNHHCGYDAIASLSSVTNNFLENGFWAYSFEEEIPIPDFTVSRLVYMKFLNPEIDEQTADITDEGEKAKKIEEITKKIREEAIEGNHYDAEIKTMFGGRDYYLMVYETFKDVRFVGAPPSSVGKYGGDTDNWMWPRHTGDFSILRVYVGPDGKPAKYAEDNIPYKPLHHLKISLDGVEQNDFSMIMGYPGTTERYLTSYDIDYKQNKEQPALIDIFTELLTSMKAVMDADPALKLEMASDYASLANYWKYLEGQNLGLKKYGLIDEYRKREAEMRTWLDKNPAMKEKYGKVFEDIRSGYEELDKLMPAYYYQLVGVRRHEFYTHIQPYMGLNEKLKAGSSVEDMKEDLERLKSEATELLDGKFFNSQQASLERFIVKWYKALDNPEEIEFFKEIKEKYGQADMTANISLYFEEMFAKSILFNKDKLLKFLDKPNRKKLEKDMGYVWFLNTNKYFRDHIMTFFNATNKVSDLNGDFIDMYREFKKGENLYPDANSTLRMSYGKVTPYLARDAVFYNYYTTHYGILDKEIPGDEEFSLDPKLKDLLINKDFGRYAEGDTLHVCFLSNNDITGGNSGSPVIDGNGNLIGIAFDGNWEAMTGDLVVDPKLNRTINVDIRYVLFIIDKLGGAKNLIGELDIAKKEVAVEEAVEAVE